MNNHKIFSMCKLTAVAVSLALSCLVFSCCDKDSWPSQPDWNKLPNPDAQDDDALLRPADCVNKIIAHRGGASESGLPDNSIASFKYSMSLGVFGVECDAYWTSDNNIIIAHGDENCEINKLIPHDNSLAQIREAGKLSNGEQLPTLEDVLDVIMDEKSCTRLIIDIKKINVPSEQPLYVTKAAKRICEIITEKGAKHFVMLLCTGFDDSAMKTAWGYAQAAGLEIGMNSGKTAVSFGSMGFNWINLAASTQMGPEAGGTGARTLKEFADAGISVSVYNVDNKAGDGNAVYSESAVNYYVKNYASLKMICTNYPKWLIDKITSSVQTKYDGISSKEDFEAFKSTLVSDPSADIFTDDNGEVVLHSDIVLDNFSPVSEFSGILNGGGHKITINYSGDSQYVGLIKSLTGTVKNLTVAGSMSTTYADGIVYFGAIACTSEGAVFNNCKNVAEMKVSSPDAANSVYMGGMVGKTSGNVTFKDCVDSSKVQYMSGNALFYGAMFGATASDAGKFSMTSCSSTAKVEFGGTNKSAWNYVGGLVGKPISTVRTSNSGTDYHLIVSGCSFSGAISVTGGGKIRAGQLCSYSNASFKIENCYASGEITNIETSARDFVCGATVGFVEKEVEGLVYNCIFSGKHSSVAGPNNYIGGILGNTSDNTALVVDVCKTTAEAYVGAETVSSVGMLLGRPKAAGCMVSNCKIAGTILKAGVLTVITAENIENWMFTGSGTTASVELSGNGFNNE